MATPQLSPTDMNKQDILSQALQQRDDEVLMYQINIDNYKRAIAKIDASGDPDLAQFREQLCGLLASECLEQKKAKVMQKVIADQLGVER